MSEERVTTAVLVSTNQTPQPPPPDVSYFPLRPGFAGSFRWTNAARLKKPEVQSFKVEQAANGSARITFRTRSRISRGCASRRRSPR